MYVCMCESVFVYTRVCIRVHVHMHVCVSVSGIDMYMHYIVNMTLCAHWNSSI